MSGYDFLIIGGGVIGVTTARAIRQKKLGSVCILEKEPVLGLHASGRNSGVLHAGIYYTPDSLKARVCSRGAKAMMTYAAERGIPCQKVGKVIVATTPGDVQTVRNLYQRAQTNGIRAELINEAELFKVEPAARTHEIALYSPDTAVIDVKAALQALEEDVIAMGVALQKNARISSLSSDRVRIAGEDISFGHLINAAGLHADSVAHRMGIAQNYSVLPFKGIYRRLCPETAARIRGLIYPAPDVSMPFLGVHTVKTTGGDAMVGPTAIPVFGRENYGILSGIDKNCFRIGWDIASMAFKNTGGFRKMMWQEIGKYYEKNFLKAAQGLVPSIRQKDLLGIGKVGLRAQLFDRKEKNLVMDFLILQGPRSTHILNAISPAFTSSMAFAEMVVQKILERR